MGKKYLSLEEAAEQLGLTTEQVMRYRESGEIRGFADRGSWKFRDQDVEEFQRSREADSSPDFPLLGDSAKAGSGSGSVLDDDDEIGVSASDSDVRLDFSMFDETEEDEARPAQPAGSDIRLAGDSGPKLDAVPADDDVDLSAWDSDVKISDSDSDVQLVGGRTDADIDLAATMEMSDSDSDVKMVGDIKLSDSDSDVRLTEESADEQDDDSGIALFDDSDSDVKLTGTDALLADDSDSDVKLGSGLGRTDSDIRLIDDPVPSRKGKAEPKEESMSLFPDDSDLKLIDRPSAVRQSTDDSGIAMESLGSGLSLDADESGISLEVDSGISLDADDSGISLESFDSGAKLGDDGSGISLDAADSGIALSLDDDSGISLDADDDMSRTMPMKAIPGAKAAMGDSNATTAFEIPNKKVGKDSEFELAGLDDDDDDLGTSTNVLKFDEEDFDGDTGQTVAVRSAAAEEEEEVFADEEFEEEYEEDYADSEMGEGEGFADEGEEGESAGFAAPVGGRTYARVEVDWGTLTKVMIGFGTVLSVAGAIVGVELVRTMWLWTQPGNPTSGILETLGGLFG